MPSNLTIEEVVPFGLWEIVDVKFPSSANVDYVIPHNLQPEDPYDVQITVLKQTTAGTVYQSTSGTTKPWNSKFIVLRSDTASWTGRLLLSLLRVQKPFNYREL